MRQPPTSLIHDINLNSRYLCHKVLFIFARRWLPFFSVLARDKPKEMFVESISVAQPVQGRVEVPLHCARAQHCGRACAQVT